jgi:hypothetical protein
MSSAVANAAQRAPRPRRDSASPKHAGAKLANSAEDYSSYKIIEMLKQDKFMNGLDKLNGAPAHSHKRRKTTEDRSDDLDAENAMAESSSCARENFDPFDVSSVLSENIELPKYDESKDYYIEYWKTFMDIKVARDELMQWADKRNEKIREVLKIMKYYDSNYENLKENKPNGRKKHNRRTAKEISKEYKCPYKCGKLYGSEGSLNLHMKLKHAGGNKTDREKTAKSLVIAQFRGEKLPDIQLNLPAGAIEEAAKELNIKFDVKLLKDLQNKAKERFEQYLDKCRKENNIDPLTNLPYVNP